MDQLKSKYGMFLRVVSIVYPPPHPLKKKKQVKKKNTRKKMKTSLMANSK